jgi:UDP-N-acetylglucosamine--N-acetylmuramyl-(pentapeptide) pyrophosphoryl-undecaprenol N-acetylglucosamine transferase
VLAEAKKKIKQMQNRKEKKLKVIISGGGTGGHVFPAISIANALKGLNQDVNILFVGAENKMEMVKVPEAGYEIVSLPVIGFERKFSLRIFDFFFKLRKSLKKARKIIKDFQPDVVVGVGGFASGPMLRIANRKGIPSLIQEQNFYAGITNKLLSKNVDKICVAYTGMEKYFPGDKIVLTGNPVRQNLCNLQNKKELAIEHFGLSKSLPVILILGGSLGARTINESVWSQLEQIEHSDVQIIWQTGKLYYNEALNRTKKYKRGNLKVYDFILKIDFAYAVADIIVSRAGAVTISELCLAGKPSILIPSPNVAEDHQTKNAMALVNKNAAIIIKDHDAVKELVKQALGLIHNKSQMQGLSKNIRKLALKNSAEKIADEISKLAKRKRYATDITTGKDKRQKIKVKNKKWY